MDSLPFFSFQSYSSAGPQGFTSEPEKGYPRQAFLLPSLNTAAKVFNIIFVLSCSPVTAYRVKFKFFIRPTRLFLWLHSLVFLPVPLWLVHSQPSAQNTHKPSSINFPSLITFLSSVPCSLSSLSSKNPFWLTQTFSDYSFTLAPLLLTYFITWLNTNFLLPRYETYPSPEPKDGALPWFPPRSCPLLRTWLS